MRHTGTWSLADIVVVLIPPDHVRRVWPQVADLVNGIGDDSNGLWSGATLLHSIEEGGRLLFVAWDRETQSVWGVAVGTIDVSDLGFRTINLVAGSGHDRQEWQDLMIDTAKKFGAEWGCRRVVLISRPGWERSLKHRPGMRKTHVFLEEAI